MCGWRSIADDADNSGGARSKSGVGKGEAAVLSISSAILLQPHTLPVLPPMKNVQNNPAILLDLSKLLQLQGVSKLEPPPLYNIN